MSVVCFTQQSSGDILSTHEIKPKKNHLKLKGRPWNRDSITDLSAQKSSRSPDRHDDNPRLLPQGFGLEGPRFCARFRVKQITRDAEIDTV